MADYRRQVAFGVFPTPEVARLAEAFEIARIADEAGLEFVGIQDHPYQRRFVDTWALMATLLARTSRVAVFPDVASLPLRPPAVLAKTAASLDVLSDGRFELGLGAGAFWPAIAGMGGPVRNPGQALKALAEAIDVIRLMWSDERSARYDGAHYQLDGVHPGPKPAHDIGIWLGVTGPKALALLGRAADGWVPSYQYVPPSALAACHARIDDAAAAAGRDPSAIRRAYNVWGTITDGRSSGDLEGPVNQWVDTLTELVIDGGMDTFVFGAAADDVAQVRRFALEVAPAVRQSIAAERASD